MKEDRLFKLENGSETAIWAARRIRVLEDALSNLLNDCINFGGDNLTESILEKASEVLKNSGEY